MNAGQCSSLLYDLMGEERLWHDLVLLRCRAEQGRPFRSVRAHPPLCDHFFVFLLLPVVVGALAFSYLWCSLR